MKIITYLTCLFFLFSACQTSTGHENSGEAHSAYEAYDQVDMEKQEAPLETKETEEEISRTPQQLIRTGDIEFTVFNLDSAYKRTLAILAQEKAFISQESLESYRGYRAYRLSIRVKPDNFESLIDEILNGSESLRHKRIETQDVSQRYYDLESRLSTKKALEKRYLQLLNKAEAVEDMLKIEAEAAQLREDIEAMEGSFRLLKNQISLSTLSVYFYEVEAARQAGIFSRLGENFKNGWTGMVDTLIGLVNVWPLFLILIVAFWGFRRYLRRRREAR